MKHFFVCFTILVWSVARLPGADSIVVFNEIMYHPPTNENALEWIELHNQMAVDIDLSAWSVSGGIDYTFPEGTIISAGGYLVLASSPATLGTVSGYTSALGPFSGHLSNSGERLELRDRNARLMDAIDYRDGAKWPVAPDGSGAALAKRDENSPSAAPENWTSSVVVGGTPGRRNFPDAAPTTRTLGLIPFDALWRFEASGTDLGVAWRAPAYDDSGWGGRDSATLISYWPFNGNATAIRGSNGTLVSSPIATTDRNGLAGGALKFNGVSQYVSVPGGGGLDGAPQGTISLWVKWTGNQDPDCCGTFGAVVARQLNSVFSDDVISLNNPNPINAKVVWRQSAGAALITSITNVGTNWHHLAVTFTAGHSELFVDGVSQGTGNGFPNNSNAGVPFTIGAWSGDGGGFANASIDDVAVWNSPLSAAQIAQLAAQTKTPLDFKGPENAAYFAGDGSVTGIDDPRHTQLPLGPTTYYFRKTFQFDDEVVRTTLKMNLAVDDGAVFYLNGEEVYRHNMPAGEVTYSTLAAAEIGTAPFTPDIIIATANLLQGTNVLAVEVHQATDPDAGMIFGADLTARVAPPDVPEIFAETLVFNEVAAAGANPFQVELFNRSQQPLDVDGFVVARSGVLPDAHYVLPAQTLPAGGFLVLDRATLGFGAAVGDRLFLYRPGQSAVADAIEVTDRNRGRSPDGLGSWLFPTAPTPGASNLFTFHDEIVINELMYHHRPRLEVPAVVQTNALVTITNVWRYEQSGADLGTAWRSPGYDDSAWPAGPALLYVATANLPAPKNTPLTLGPTTYYFRTTFTYDGVQPLLSLALRHIVDDGAAFYLNGAQILRFNLPVAATNYTNFASPSVGNAVFSAPVFISLTNLVIGTNMLAVEVHQGVTTGNDIVFGAELNAAVETVPRVPYQASAEEWVELFNRNTNAIDLTGWRLDEGIDFRFAAGTMIQPGGYLVVAHDPVALRMNYPAITIVGPYTNRLSHTGERIVLKDASNNPANTIHYFDNGRWPEAADGGGSSLELKNPFADNSVGEAWAASNEGTKSSWQTYTYRGVAAPSATGPDGQWKEFVLGLLNAGEVLLDDISVVEGPTNAVPVQQIQNGSFTTGADHWRIIGDHRHSEVIDDPDQPGNKVLRLVATGGTEHMSNHGETTLAGGRDTVNGRLYEISFRAKWISGSRQLHTRLYFNRLPHTTLLAAPELHGTPGAQNSTYVPNLGPTYYDFRHEPAVPAPFEPVTVSVRASDPDGVASLKLWSSVNSGAWVMSMMTDNGDGNFSGIIPGRGAGTIVQFYVEGMDALGAVATFPASGTNSSALFKVNDGLAATNGLHNIRLIVSPADADWLQNNLNVMSNDKVGCTVIYDEREVFYDVGVRLKGSEHSRTEKLRLGFDVKLSSEHLFRGVHSELGIDRSESTGFGQREMLIHQTINHAGGLPTKYSDLIQVITPRLEHTGSAELQLARYSDVFLDAQYDHGSDGMLFEYELVYQLNSTDTGQPEGNKVPFPDSVIGINIQNMGDDKENYRWTFLIKNNTDRDDYRRLMEFAKTMGLSGPAFNTGIVTQIDVDQWLRAFALCTLSGAGDNYGGDGAQHNLQLYVRPGDQKVMFMPHDIDAFFDATRPLAASGDLNKLIATPSVARAYYRQVRDIIATTYNGTYMTYWANHYGRLLPAQPFAAHLQFIKDRVNNLNNAINSVAPAVAFAITSNNGNDFLATSNSVAIQGNAALDVKDILPQWQSAAAGPDLADRHALADHRLGHARHEPACVSRV